MASGTARNVPYMFKRNFRSSMRLNYNHWIMRDITGYLLHPNIPVAGREDLRIADIGTGTALWLFELSAQLPPSTRFDGFDLSSDNYPPKAWWGASVNLTTHDCFKPFPSEYLGRFDVVNLRFLLCGINDPDAEPLLKNLMTLLRPGGHLQWFEPRPQSAKPLRADPSVATPGVDKLVMQWHKSRPDSSNGWVERLPDSMRSHEMEVVAHDIFPIPTRCHQLWSHSLLAALEDLTDNVDLLGVGKAEEIKKWKNEVAEEFEKGNAVETDVQCVVGKKPE